MRLNQIQSILFAAVLGFPAAAAGQTSVAPAVSGAPGAAETVVPVKVPPLDVISVKPNKSAAGGSSWGATPDGVMGKNLAVHMMLVSAYGLNDNQLVNEPAWASTECFDVTGKVADADVALVAKLTPDQKRVFFEQVLKQRFGLVAHHETRELPEYALMSAKGGAKLEDAKPDPKASPDKKPNEGWFSMGMSSGVKKVVFSGVPLTRLVPLLSNEAGRVVVDKTGLTGKYSFTLSWRPALAHTGADDAADSTPDLFTAIQEQLGLKLEPARGPVDVVVIDHIERPAEN